MTHTHHDLPLQPHHALAALAVLGLSGKHWGVVQQHGGPRGIAAGGSQSLLRVLTQAQQEKQGQRTSRLAQQILDQHSVHCAVQQAQQLDAFVQSGGQILGTHGMGELGRLARAPQVPLCVFLVGNLQHVLHRPAVAIVGSRAACLKGLQRTRQLATVLAKQGASVVSGGAVGADYAAHEGAVAGGGCTLAVLGDPLQAHKPLCPTRLAKLRSTGLLSVLTPFGPWTPSAAFLFASRNQYMAALADAVVIVQGGVNSGTLYTARYARRLGVPLWAMPGDLNDPLAGAANWLLEQGWARAYTRPEHIVQQVFGRKVTLKVQDRDLTPGGTGNKGAVDSQMQRANTAGPVCGSKENSIKLPEAIKNNAENGHEKPAIPPLTQEQSNVMGIMQQGQGVVTVDELCHKLSLGLPQVQACLLQLELMGLVKWEGAQVVLK